MLISAYITQDHSSGVIWPSYFRAYWWEMGVSLLTSQANINTTLFEFLFAEKESRHVVKNVMHGSTWSTVVIFSNSKLSFKKNSLFHVINRTMLGSSRKQLRNCSSWWYSWGVKATDDSIFYVSAPLISFTILHGFASALILNSTTIKLSCSYSVFFLISLTTMAASKPSFYSLICCILKWGGFASKIVNKTLVSHVFNTLSTYSSWFGSLK